MHVVHHRKAVGAQQCSVRAYVPTKYDTLPLPPSPCPLLMVGKRCVPSATRPAPQWVATTSQGTQEVGASAVP